MAPLFRRAWTKDPSHLAVRYGDQDFTVTLKRRAAAKRMTLRVSAATGDIVLTVPDRVTASVAQRFAEDHGGWIAARVSRLPERIPFSPGQDVPVRGIPHRIAADSSGRSAARVATDPAGDPVIAVRGDPDAVAGRVRRLLVAEAGRDLRAAVTRHTAALGIPARQISVRDTRSRWGSCSSSGALSFSWRLIMAPPLVLDYLAAHEVAHLRELNHSQRFWRLTRQLCPATDEAEAWLKRHGTALHRYG